MLFKFNVANITITESFNGRSTNLHIDNISIEDECNAEEAKELITAIADIAKELNRNKNKRRNINARYHIYSLMHNHFVHDIKNDKYYTISGNEPREVTKEAYWRMINRVKNNIREGYFDNGLKEYYSDTLPAAE